MNVCRNCGSSELKELGFTGAVAPFFLKRVFMMELGSPTPRHPAKIAILSLLRPAKSLIQRLYSTTAMVELQVCSVCSFLQMKHEVPEEWINRLYSDYRSESYNRERIHYEPSYAAIARHIGLPQEAETRVRQLTLWLEGKIEVSADFTMLDFGGADGRFLPSVPAKKFVYEISDYPIAPDVTRVTSARELGEYSYVQLAHVLEHVLHPLRLVSTLVENVKPGGYLYLEVPQETDDETLQGLKRGEINKNLSIHEHINGYSSLAMAKLVESAGLELVAIEREQVDYGYAAWTIVRALGRKNSN
jgi:hypothetical protein